MSYREPYREYRRPCKTGLREELKKRRVFPFLGIFLASGFLVVEGIDQAIGHGLLPEIAYQIGLVLYLFGIPGTTIIAWFHGEKGYQRPTLTEAWMHIFMLVGALGICYGLIRGHNTITGAAAEALGAGLDPQRVAVLYFEDHSSNGKLAYLADGLTETLIGQLSHSRSLDVVSRNGVAPFRRPGVALDSVARALEAGSLIVGTVEGRESSIYRALLCGRECTFPA
jgi:serine/threonine-protein kinase